MWPNKGQTYVPSDPGPLTAEQEAAREYVVMAEDVEADRACVRVTYPQSLEVRYMIVTRSLLPELRPPPGSRINKYVRTTKVEEAQKVQQYYRATLEAAWYGTAATVEVDVKTFVDKALKNPVPMVGFLGGKTA